VSDLHPPPPASKDPATNILTALDLVEFGLEVTLCRLRREHPGASEADIRERYLSWLRERNRPAPDEVLRPVSTLTVA
jgi:hypothetical protein